MPMAIACYPGSINLLGEHALVFANEAEGGHGIRLAVNKFLSVEIRAREAEGISVTGRLVHEEGALQDIDNAYVRAALAQFAITDGLAITITDDLPETVGLGSSAALSAALAQALSRYRDHTDLSDDQLFATARAIMREVQGKLGSGIDIAGSVYTGCVALNAKELTVERLPMPPAISVLYSGYKTPTPELLAKVRDQGKPQKFFDAMDALTQKGIAYARDHNWQALGGVMDDFQRYMLDLGLSTLELDKLQATLSGTPCVYGAKIAGAGLGDSVIAIGEPDHRNALMDHPAFIDVEGYRDDN